MPDTAVAHRGDLVRTIDPLPTVRQAVRALLLASPSYFELDAGKQQRLAELLVRVCHTAAQLLLEEIDSDGRVQAQGLQVDGAPADGPEHTPSGRRPTLARAQNAGSEFSGVSAERVAGTTQAILNAVSFPRFVTELINGVFKAIGDTNMQQMNSFIELLNNVAASTEGFAEVNMGDDRARQWLVERYPGSFEMEGEADDEGWGDEEQSAEPSATRLRLRSGAAMPSPEALRVDLGLGPNDTPPTGDPENLVPFARRQLARQRQEMLATMVMLGLQRIVIDGGKIHASMRFHIDTRSAAQSDRGSTFDLHNTVSASGRFGVGPWGASASITNTIGYVSTQRTQTTEEMNTDLDLSSSVELIFRTDQVPLNRMANATQITQIMANSRNPQAEAEQASRERTARSGQAAQTEAARSRSVSEAVAPRPVPAPAATPAPGAPQPANTSQGSRPSAAQRSGQGGGDRPAAAARSGTSAPPAPAASPAPAAPRGGSTAQPGASTPPASPTPPAPASPPGGSTAQPGTSTPPASPTPPAPASPPGGTTAQPGTSTPPASPTPPIAEQ